MKALANFIMRGPSQGALVAATASLLSLLVPLFGVVSAAAVGLVTMRNGARAGALVVFIATLGAGVLYTLILGSPWLALLVLGMLWGPVWGLALVLRVSRSLAWTIGAAVLLISLALVLVHLIIGDLGAYWLHLLKSIEAMSASGGAKPPGGLDLDDPLIVEVTHWMTGALAVVFLVQLLAAVFLARWWQALLYYPGGFGEEFRQYRLHRPWGVYMLLLLGAWSFTREPGLVTDLLMVMGVALMFEGLAVAHQLRFLRNGSQAWLFLLYFMLIVLFPQTSVILASIGLVDVWADFRARAAQKPTMRR